MVLDRNADSECTYLLRMEIRETDRRLTCKQRLEDIGSLIRFLRITPFDSNAIFKNHISEPLLTDRRHDEKNLRSLLGSICLRRTRSLLKLPDAKDRTILLTLSEAERALYDETIEESRRRIDGSISSSSITKAYNGIFQAILRLRLLCNHGTTRTASEPDSGISDETSVRLHGPPLGIQEGRKAACAFCSYELTVSDVRGSDLPSTSRKSVELLCPTCLSQNEIRLDGYEQRGDDQYMTNAGQPDQNDFLQYRYADGVVSSSPRAPKLSSNGNSSKLAGLVKNINENKQGSKRYRLILSSNY